MTKIVRYIGGAGTGKTRLLMDRLRDCLERGVDPFDVGFVSFTRIARQEAAERAQAVTGIGAERLMREGWFRTLHAVCFAALGARREDMLSGDSRSKAWIRDNVGVDVGAPVDDEGVEAFRADESIGSRSLAVWDLARLRLESLADTIQAVQDAGGTVPRDAVETAVIYERAKRLDGKLDFVDLAMKFAGITLDPEGGEPRETVCCGNPPILHTWFFDEQQDTSPLLDRVCLRLTETATWVYVVGDPMQALYGFAGSDGRIFQEWPADHEAVMPKSYRCPPAIHEFGERCLKLASNYWDRGIAPADHKGFVETRSLSDKLIAAIDPSESWLILARTNYHVSLLAGKFADRHVPWAPTRGAGGWAKPAWRENCWAALLLQRGDSIEWKYFRKLVAKLPAALFVRGAKAAIAKSPPVCDSICIDNLEQAGATPELVDLTRRGELIGKLDDGVEFASAVADFGVDVVENPRVRIGTIHSAKGAEADNVLWLTSSTKRIAEAAKRSDAVRDEECRVSYVAATRARKRLIVVNDPTTDFKMPVPPC